MAGLWTNEDRARLGKQALYGYAEIAEGGEYDGPDVMLTDLLANLMHAARDLGIDFDQAVETAELHYIEERTDDAA